MHSLQTQQAAAAVKAAVIGLLVAVADEYQLEVQDVHVHLNVDQTNDVTGVYEMSGRGVEMAGGSL